MRSTTARHSSTSKRLAAAAALLAASQAFAGDFMAEAGVTYGDGSKVETGHDGRGDSFFLSGAFGYTFDNGVGVRGLFFGDDDPFRGLFPVDRTFDNFSGIEATLRVPLAPKLSLMGGVGAGRTVLDEGGPDQGGRQDVGDGVVSAGLQYRFVRNFAMELHVDYLTHSNVSNIGLMFQVPF